MFGNTIPEPGDHRADPSGNDIYRRYSAELLWRKYRNRNILCFRRNDAIYLYGCNKYGRGNDLIPGIQLADLLRCRCRNSYSFCDRPEWLFCPGNNTHYPACTTDSGNYCCEPGDLQRDQSCPAHSDCRLQQADRLPTFINGNMVQLLPGRS